MGLVAVTDHAVERYRQRVRGSLHPRTEIAARVGRALAAGSVEPGERGARLVRDLERPSLVYVCMEDLPRGELIVVTLWEEGEPVHPTLKARAAASGTSLSEYLRSTPVRPRRRICSCSRCSPCSGVTPPVVRSARTGRATRRRSRRSGRRAVPEPSAAARDRAGTDVLLLE